MNYFNYIESLHGWFTYFGKLYSFYNFYINTVVKVSNSLLELLAYCIIPSSQKLNGEMVQDSSLLVFHFVKNNDIDFDLFCE